MLLKATIDMLEDIIDYCNLNGIAYDDSDDLINYLREECDNTEQNETLSD